MNTDYSKWAVPCLIREIGRKWPGADVRPRTLGDMTEGEGFMVPNHTIVTRVYAFRFLRASEDWDTEEAKELKKYFRAGVNAWLAEQRKLHPTTAELRNV